MTDNFSNRPMEQMDMSEETKRLVEAFDLATANNRKEMARVQDELYGREAIGVPYIATYDFCLDVSNPLGENKYGVRCVLTYDITIDPNEYSYLFHRCYSLLKEAQELWVWINGSNGNEH